MKEIQEAVIDNFFTFDLFDNTKGNIEKKYFSVLEKLQDFNFIIIGFDTNKKVTFQQSFLDEMNRRKKLSFEKNLTRIMKKDFISAKGNKFIFNSFEAYPNITEENKTIDLLHYSQNRALQHYVRVLASEEHYTGINTLQNKNSFLLYPIRIETVSNEIIYIDIYLTIYKHGYGILNASVRIKDEGIDKLSQNMWNIDINSAYLPNFMFDQNKKNKYEYKKIGRCTTINEATTRYIDILEKLLKIKITYSFNFDCLTILKMKKQPDNFEKEGDSLYKEIYKLLSAPIEYTSISNKIAKEKVNKNSKQHENNMKIFINSKRFIMIYGKDIYKRLKDEPEEIQKEILYSSFRSDIIFALEKLFLKNITSYKYLERLSNPDISLNKMYTILENRDFELRYESDQLFYGYASTREYIDFFIDKGIEPSIDNAIKESVDRVKNLILLRRENRLNQITIVGTILALVFTALFSMSGIENTLNTLGIFNKDTIISIYKIIVSLTFIVILSLYKDIIILRPYYKTRNILFHIYIKYENILKNFFTNL